MKITFDLEWKIPSRWYAWSEKWGYGLTRVMNPLLYFIEANYWITEVCVTRNINSEIDWNILKLNRENYYSFFRQSQSYLASEKSTKENFINNYLADIVPQKFKKKKINYTPWVIKRSLDWLQNINLSTTDQDALLNILSWSTITSTVNLLKSREVINEKYIEDVIKEYEELMEQKTETSTLEKKWQSFFKQHNRIFSQILALPVVYFQDEAYIWWKWLSNKWWKIIDFLYQNKLASNLVLIEVKTHKTSILSNAPIRWIDVFAHTSHFSWAISQLLDQKHNLLREYATLVSKSADYFEVFDPYCFLIAGCIWDLTDEQKKCFSLLRSNNRNIVIITYDELLEKIKMVLWLFK